MGFRLSSVTDDSPQETHDINVTPFIDIMLVLLIIFMVAAPLATVSVPVDLPPSGVRAHPVENQPLYVTLQADKTVTVGEKNVISLEQLGETLQKTLGDETDARIYVRADKSVAYGDVMELMSRISQAGYYKVALVALEAL